MIIKKLGSKQRIYIIQLIIAFITLNLLQASEIKLDLYREICAVIARESSTQGNQMDNFSDICLKHAPRAQKGLKWLIDKNDHAFFARHIDLLLAELNLTEARYYPPDTKENDALSAMIKFGPIAEKVARNSEYPHKKRTRSDSLQHYAHKLSDGSILLLPPEPATKSLVQKNNGDEKKLVIHFFGGPTCGECYQIRTKILETLSEQYADILEVRIHDIDDEDGYKLLDAMEKAYEVKESLPIQLYFPDTLLAGGESITKYGKGLIEKYLTSPSEWKYKYNFETTKSSAETIRERFQEFSFICIVAAGLVDGINPCAIATMIFLISFLATQKRKRSEVLVIGLCFTFSVYLTYLFLGLGAFKVLTVLDSYRWLSEVIKWSAVLLAGGVGMISFYDAAAYAMSRKAASIKLQLPKAVKLRIHKVVSENLTGSSLVLGAVITGFIVTLLEAVCTGQVYLPTIVLMTRQGGLRLQGWLYLILYNFLFVLQLLIVMLLAYWGLTWKSLSSATQKHLPLLKVLLGIVLIGLAVFLGISM